MSGEPSSRSLDGTIADLEHLLSLYADAPPNSPADYFAGGIMTAISVLRGEESATALMRAREAEIADKAIFAFVNDEVDQIDKAAASRPRERHLRLVK